MKSKILVQLAGAVLLLSAACAEAKAEDPNVVAVFGDSTSLGFNTNFPGGGFRFGMGQLNFLPPSIELTKILNGSRRNSVVPNLGWGGTASGPAESRNNNNINGVDRISGNLSDVKRDNPGKAYYVLIMYGVNDFNFGIPASTTGFNNRLMIDRANAQGFTALVSSIIPCDICGNSASFVNTVNSSIRSNVQQRINAGADAYFVDNFAAVRPLWNPALPNSYVDPDGIHPTDEGYAVIARNWFSSRLEQLIEQDPLTITPIIGLLLDDD